MTVPPLSVVMPVRNALPFLDSSIESILGQTFADFEFVIGDDGSSDGSTERLREWARRDRRIVLHRNPGPALGPARSSDWVARLARAPLVARMDADDISKPDRLRRQLDLLERRRDSVMVASLWEGIDDAGRKVHGRDRSTLSGSGGCPFVHGSIMYRREAFQAVGGYRRGTDYFEDGDLFLRLAAAGTVLVLPEPLYLYRWSSTSSRFQADRERVESAYQLGIRWSRECLRQEVPVESLDEWREQAEGSRLDPQVFLGLAFPAVWNGRRPRLLGRFLARAELRLDRPSLHAAFWLVAGTLFPRMLRKYMRDAKRRRDGRAAGLVDEGTPYDWTFSPAAHRVERQLSIDPGHHAPSCPKRQPTSQPRRLA